MRSLIPPTIAVILFATLAGCASQPTNEKSDESYTSISIEYLSNGTSYRKRNLTYKLLPMKGGEFDLKLIKVGKEFKRILKASGIEESSNPDIIVFFDFGSGGITSNEHSIPYAIKGQTGVASSTTTGTIIGGNISMRTTVTPTYGTTGYGEYKYKTYTTSYHLSMMAVNATDFKKGDPKQLWVVTAASAGPLFDEDLNLKAMLMAIKDHIGGYQDVSYASRMTRGTIVNPPPHMELDVDGVTERSNLQLRKINDLLDLHKPQPYSKSNQNQEIIKKVNNWDVFCQKKDDKIIGCGMTDSGMTVFIEKKGYTATILVGRHELLSAGSEVCLELDADIACLKIEGQITDRSLPKYKAFGGDLFWRLEKTKQVKVSYAYDKGTTHVDNVNMIYYLDALDILRRSLP